VKRYNVVWLLVVISVVFDVAYLLFRPSFLYPSFLVPLNVLAAVLLVMAWLGTPDFRGFLCQKPIRIHLLFAVVAMVLYSAGKITDFDDVASFTLESVFLTISALMYLYIMTWPPQPCITQAEYKAVDDGTPKPKSPDLLLLVQFLIWIITIIIGVNLPFVYAINLVIAVVLSVAATLVLVKFWPVEQ